MRETYAERTLRSDLCVCPTCDDCPREHYASTIYDLLVQLNDGTYSRDVDEAEEAKQRLFLLYPIQSGYDHGRCWYANSGPASILSRADRVEVYHGMHCTFYAPEDTDKAIADFAAGA
jgi:hypothetical protein